MARVTQPGLECFPPKEEVAGSNPVVSVAQRTFFEPFAVQATFQGNELASAALRLLRCQSNRERYI